MHGCKFMERRSRPGAMEDDTLVSAVIDNFPRFRKIVARFERFAENTLQTAPAPQVAAEERRES